MVSGTVDGTGADGDVDAGVDAVERPSDVAFGASVTSVAALALGLAGAYGIFALVELIDDPNSTGDLGVVVALIGFLASNVAALLAWARLRRRTRWRWLVVLPARSWALLWGSLLMLWVVTSIAPGTVLSVDQGYERTAYGWPRRWLVQEQPDDAAGPDKPSVYDDAINESTYADPFWADWFVAAVIVVGLAVLLRLAFRLAADGEGRHRLVRGGLPQDGSDRTTVSTPAETGT